MMVVDYDVRPVADKRLFDAQARCAKLEAVVKYAKHIDNCPASVAVTSCRCRLTEALAALKEDE